MIKQNSEYEIIVIGAGLGGLLCAALLSIEGYKVAVFEKNKQIGGNLQSFAVDGKLFESAVHYIGSLQKGQTLYKIFNYLDIINDISLKKLDEYCFDKIIFNNQTFFLAQGYQNFIETLALQFPSQKQNLENYIREIKTVCAHFPLYNMRMGSIHEKNKVAHFSLKERMEALISDATLRQILMANNMLYASHYETTPFFIHALITNSYIESSYKCEKGSIQIAKKLEKIIHAHHGKVFKNREIKCMQEEEGEVKYVLTNHEEKYFAKYFISNLHPSITYDILQSDMVRNVTKKRIKNTKNTTSALMINISLKEKSVLYQNHNTYYHTKPNVWFDIEIQNNQIPTSFGLFFYQDKLNTKYATAMSILVCRHIDEFEEWKNSFRTTSKKEYRDKDYHLYKEHLANKIIEEVNHILPQLKENISKIDICSPLSYRDYLNIPDGAMYGLENNVFDLANTTFSTSTKIKNLFLTGQNINMHGILGVSITALLTTGEIIGLEYLLDKINKANA